MANKLLVVLAYHEGDWKLAVELLDWIGKLGAIRENDMLLVADSTMSRLDSNRVLVAARRVAKSVTRILATGKGWPAGPNAMFKAAYATADRAFLWLEPDATPTRTGWLQEIEAEYETCGAKFMGDIVQAKPPMHFEIMNGVAVYAPNIIDLSLIEETQAFDVSLAPYVTASGHKSKLFQFFSGPGNTRPNVESLSNVRQDTVLLHSDKSHTLIKLLENKSSSNQPDISESEPTQQQKTFLHSGDLGDIVYSLPVIRALGGGSVIISPALQKPPFATREPMTEDRARAIIPLLLEQPYITGCRFEECQPSDCIDINDFRELFSAKFDGMWTGINLSTLMLEKFVLPHWLENERWISVYPKKPMLPVVVNRTQRYRNPEFDWRSVFRKFKGRMCFIGLKSEYEAFCSELQTIPYQPTEDLLEAARFIAGSELFVGNQSCCYSISEGLKHQSILEWVPGQSQNCRFNRKGVFYGTGGNWRTIEERKKINWVVVGDSHSGLGRMSVEFAKRIESFDLNVVASRTTDEFVKYDGIGSVCKTRGQFPSIVIEAVPELHKIVQPGDVVYSMWESSRLPKEAVTALNTAKCCIVPSDWCKNVYEDSGVKTPIFKVPLGIDQLAYFNTGSRKHSKQIRFGASARLCRDDNPRKNLNLVVDGFESALGSNRNAVLEIKSYDLGSLRISNPKNVKLFRGFWSINRMRDWYNSLDYFINLPSGGGWELHVQEAMACGAVPIYLDWSSSLEFCNPFVGIPVQPNFVTPEFNVYAGCGVWAKPDMESYRDALIEAVSDFESIETKRRKSEETAKKITYDSSAAILDEVLRIVLC